MMPPRTLFPRIPTPRTSPHLRTPTPLPRRAHARPLSTQPRPPSRHAQFYTDYVAGMIPVALLGSAVYIGLRTWQQHLAHEKFLEESQERVQHLEAEVIALRQQLETATGEDAPQPQNAPSESKKRSGWRLW